MNEKKKYTPKNGDTEYYECFLKSRFEIISMSDDVKITKALKEVKTLIYKIYGKFIYAQ